MIPCRLQMQKIPLLVPCPVTLAVGLPALSFQDSWEQLYSWLEYVTSSKQMFCCRADTHIDSHTRTDTLGYVET